MRRSFGALGIGALSVFAMIVVTPSAASAYDGSPCGGPWWHPTYGTVQTCPDWSPDNWIPVYNGVGPYGAFPVDAIYAPGDDWYICQFQGPTAVVGSYENDWWAWTVGDNGRSGWVPEVYFAGGGNYEPDANLAYCP
jgi:hypothetical protein